MVSSMVFPGRIRRGCALFLLRISRLEVPMRFDSLNPELRQWLQSSVEAGHDRQVLQQAMRSAGYDAAFARQAVDAALARLRSGAPAVARSAAPVADPFADAPNTIATGDRTVEVLMVLDSPRIVLFGNLLSAQECEQMIEAARLKLEPSTVVNAETGAYDVHPDRTSSGMHFERGENELIARVERRIGELIGCPAENGEPIQVLHYTPGAEYKPHHDYFDPTQPGNDTVLAMGGQRIATLVMYLNDVAAGGSTVFPSIGLDVLPRRGCAVYFSYLAASGATDDRTLHGGSPVVAGEKWIATKWLRQRRYGRPDA
jgi:prolyl 4-hydroxylase